MTATDELRRLLDERGVEHEDDCRASGGDRTRWGSNEFIEWCKGSWLTAYDITPEQAIAATLGRGTCRDLAEFRGFGTKTEFRCSECGYEYSAVGGFGCDYGDEPDFRYCPNCGREVVE